MEPALRFVEPPLETNMEGIYLSRFREQGWTILPGVFEAASVDEYRAQLEAAIRPGPSPHNPFELPNDSPLFIWPVKAPRLLTFVRRCLPSSALPISLVLQNIGWIIRPSHPEHYLVHDWHKDGDHEGISCSGGYTPPNFLHTAMYFEDMTPERGPTWVVSRSHRDPRLSPFEDNLHETPFLPNKSDVVVWDPRLWHRGGARTEDGKRIAAFLNFFGAVVGNHAPITPSPAQQQALKEAQSGEEQILFGGPFAFGEN